MIVDFHTHILPGVDDGSSSLAQSIAMLEAEAAQGIHRVIATPHFYARYDDPREFLQKREWAEQELRQALKERPELPEVLVGAEVFYFPGMSDSEILPQLTIGGRSCILIEMPASPWNPSVYRELEQIYEKQKLIPVVAHVERYIRLFRDYGIPERLAQMPVMVQANAAFFLHPAGRKKALHMLKKDQIQLLGSDCHNMHERAPDLGEALHLIRGCCGQSILEKIAAYQHMLLGKETSQENQT